MTPGALRASISSIDPRTDTYERALHVIERRTVVLGVAPGLGTTESEQVPLPDPSSIDPWKVRQGELEGRPRVVSICPTCKGLHKTPCRTCEGEGQVACDVCDGAGVVGRKTCEACAGAGGMPCPSCVRGEIDCPTCAATGRVRAWLALEAKTFSHVAVIADGTGVEAHVNVRSPSDFDAGPSRWKNELFHDTGAVRTTKGLPPELLPPLDRRMDRLRSTRVQSFASYVHRLPYESPFGSGVIEVAGSPPVVTPASAWRPLRLRRAMLLLVLAASVWVALMVRHGYTARHPWFATHGDGGAVLVFGLGAAAFGTIAAGGLLTTPRAWSVVRTWLPALLAGAMIALTIAATRHRAPSLAHAEARLATGDLEVAALEADALEAIAGETATTSRILDEVHVERVRRAPSLASARVLSLAPWKTDDARAIAVAEVRRRADDARTSAVKAGDASALFALGDELRNLDPESSRAAFAAGAALRVDECVTHATFPCELHASELSDSLAQAFERRLEIAYADAAVEKGDWDAALARMDRWRGELAAEAPAVRARAAESCAKRLARTLAELRAETDPAKRRDLADRALGFGRAVLRFSGRDPAPTVAALAGSLAEAERVLEAAERREVLKRGVGR